MGEFTLVLAGLTAICLLASLIYARKNPPTVQAFDTGPVDYIVTIWAEEGAAADAAPPLHDPHLHDPHLHKITVEYGVLLQADSAEELSTIRGEAAHRASADFRQRFSPMFGEINIGAVAFEPLDERE